MKEHYFDDLKTGDRFKSEPLNVTVKEVVEFAHKFDPQMFHLSRRRAERSIFKGLIASGWHTAAMSMRLFVKTLNFAEGAIGLGVDELRWPNAVRPGDVLTVETEILELRPSRSRPNQGILRLRNVTTNQRGEIVQTMLASAMVPKRDKADRKLRG
jgi:acyl dehydratase